MLVGFLLVVFSSIIFHGKSSSRLELGLRLLSSFVLGVTGSLLILRSFL